MSERGELTSVTAVDWFSALSGGAAVQGSGKNRSEEDLVTVRFKKYHPSRVAIEGLGRNLQFLVSISVFSVNGPYDLWIGEICFLRLSFVYDRTQDGVIGRELCLCTELTLAS